MKNRKVMFDQIQVEVHADVNMTVEDRRKVLKFCRELPESLLWHVRDSAPCSIRDKVEIKVTK